MSSDKQATGQIEVADDKSDRYDHPEKGISPDHVQNVYNVSRE